LSPYIEGNCYEHDKRVENCECGVEFARAEPRKIWLSTNQSTGIPPGGEPEAAEHGCPIAARYDGLTGDVAKHLTTPRCGRSEITSLLPPEQVMMISIASMPRAPAPLPSDTPRAGAQIAAFGRQGGELSPISVT
jgi:hypothetical protein